MTSRAKRVLRVANSIRMARRTRRFLAAAPGLSDSLAYVRRSNQRLDGGVRLIQVDSEILALCRRVAEMNPTRILEIGTAGGGTLLMFAAIADDDATLISIDLPQPEGYGRHRERIYRAFGRGRQQIDLIRADSHLHDTLDQVRLRLGDAPLDFLFIDGDHSGSGVRQDFEMYAPLVRRGGIIALHDIVPGPTELVGGVPEFWAELRGSLGNASEEIIEDRAQGGLGIGVIVAT